jgi:cell division protein FtsQ
VNQRRRDPAAGPLLSTAAMRQLARALLGATAFVVLAGAAAWLMRRPWFDLRGVDVVAADRGGLRHVSAQAVRTAAGRLRGNFFTLRLDEARRVFEAVPWVASVSVRRAWPNRIVVALTEHRAIGIWEDGRLLSDTGRLFIANVAEAELDGPLPGFEGPPAFAAEACARWERFGARLAPLGLTLAGVSVSERASWTLRTESGLRIELGRDEPAGLLDRRLAQLVEHYPTIVAQLKGPPARIDARYSQGFAAAPEPKKKS